MSEKLGQGIIWEQPPTEEARQAAHEGEKARLTKRRDDARWYIIVGVGLMFASGVSVGFAVGGALMSLYGITTSLYWSRRLVRFDDPWDDDDIDAWEQEHYG